MPSPFDWTPPERKYLQRDDFPFCCGADVICEWPEHTPNPTELKAVEESFKKKMAGPNSLMFIILTQHQKKHFEPMIKEAGFRTLMADCYHNGHGNYLTLYGWRKFKEGDKLPPPEDDDPIDGEYD